MISSFSKDLTHTSVLMLITTNKNSIIGTHNLMFQKHIPYKVILKILSQYYLFQATSVQDGDIKVSFFPELFFKT